MKTVAIIEDQTAIREMVTQAILDPEQFKLVLGTGDGAEGCQRCLEIKPDFVILDVMLPNLNGTQILHRFSKELPETRVLIFSGFQNSGLIRELILAGAHGFVEKSSSLSELKKGIEIVSDGGSYFGPNVAQLLREAMTDPAEGDGSVRMLTRRELEILQLIAESNSTRQIAEKLGISAKTAENHRTNLMRKLDLHDVAGLTRYAITNGIISLG